MLQNPPIPSLAEVKAVIPAHCFERSFARSALYAMMSLLLTIGGGIAGWMLLPLSWQAIPLWLVYGYVMGTIATGVWVVAHECGHRAFSTGTRAQDVVGFVLHTALLVPYFSWQRSHAIHHGKTNHLIEGETHVPKRNDHPRGVRALAARRRIGVRTHGAFTIASRLTVGWPAYLVAGLTGGAERGVTNHFWPRRPFSGALFPDRWKRKVHWSSIGVVIMILALGSAAYLTGEYVRLAAVYLLPYLFVNGWLVTYTWLQHTNEDVPHYADGDWSFVRGAFCSVDRPYGPIANFLHHGIGTTHVAHHLDAKIPHYHAAEATKAIATAFPALYRFDSTPIRKAMWRIAKNCHVVAPTQDGWQFVEVEAHLANEFPQAA